jgi:hypothetical protein
MRTGGPTETKAINRVIPYVMVGNRLLVEHWYPSSKFPDSSPNATGYAIRAK